VQQCVTSSLNLFLSALSFIMKSFNTVFAFIATLAFNVAFAQPAQKYMHEGPVKVELKEENGAWQMYRGGMPYYIKGVGGQTRLDKAVEYGANSLRKHLGRSA